MAGAISNAAIVRGQPARLTRKGIVSLVVTAALCLPSVVGGAALATQSLLYHNMSEWKEAPSALIALGALMGGPMVALAALVGAIVSLTHLPRSIKYVHLVIVAIGVMATIALLIRFAR